MSVHLKTVLSEDLQIRQELQHLCVDLSGIQRLQKLQEDLEESCQPCQPCHNNNNNEFMSVLPGRCPPVPESCRGGTEPLCWL